MTPLCPLADAVIAHFLDGDATHSDLSPDVLAQHATECPSCQQQLAQSRRLDALLATRSHVDLDEETTDRWLAPLALTATRTTRRPMAPRLLTLAAVAAGGFFAALGLQQLVGPSAANPAAEPAVALPVTTTASEPVKLDERSQPERVASEVAPLGTLLLPQTAAPRRPSPMARTRSAASDRLAAWSSVLADRRLEHRLLPNALWYGSWLPPIDQGNARRLAAAEATRRRLHAVQQLAVRGESGGLDALSTVLTAEPSGALLEQAVGWLRTSSEALSALRLRLPRGWPDSSLATLCCMVGDPTLDTQLKSLAQGRPDLAERYAGHAGRIAARPGRVAFLLALWGDLEALGAEPIQSGQTPANELRARRWFGQLPPATTAELIAAAQTTRHATQRERCLLALAVRADAAALPYLLERLEGPRYEEAALAAYALSRLPPTVLTPYARDQVRRSRRPALWLAALASSRSPAFAPYADRLELSAAERQFLLSGTFHLDQLVIAATLLHTRAPSDLTSP